MPANLDGFVWLLLMLGPLFILQRTLHREVQLIFLVLTRRADIALALFSFMFFPGVVLHEGSHYLMARLLAVRTGRLSLIPKVLPNGRLQMGYVETAPSDWLRDSLVGAAPLLAGGLFVAYAGLARLGILDLWDVFASGGLRAVWAALPGWMAQPDFWLWFYLALTVSSTMLPSASDRQSWRPLMLVILLLLGGSLLAGAGPWLAANMASPLNQVLRAVALVFSFSVFIHLVFCLPLWGLRRLLMWMFRLEVV